MGELLPDTEISDARSTLLSALDSLDEAEAEYGPASKTYLVVAWAHQVKGKTIRGWNSTDDPTFATCALLREVADGIENDWGGDDEEGDGDAVD